LVGGVALVCVAVVGGCSSAGTSSGAGPTHETSVPAAELRLVALGDSDTTGSGDPTGQGWVRRYAALVEQQTGRAVDVRNRATNGETSDQLLDRVRTDASLRDDIAAADIIVLGTGGADLNAGDDALVAGNCAAEACYHDDLESFGRSLDDVGAVIAELRRDQPTILRGLTPPNALPGAEDVIPPILAAVATEVVVYQATSLLESMCTAMHNHGGECIDVLTAFNGPDGTGDAYQLGLMNHDDCCYPNDAGQQLMAELLMRTGLEAVVLR
jgi:lysophospholipase L1-like esterase